jgi:cytoskeletal protein RodZ
MELGKPDKYLRGLKYENRKNRNNDDERFGSDRPKRQGGSNAVFLLIVAIILGVGGWFIWRWTEQNNTTPEVESVTTEQEVVEPADSLNSAAPEQAPATTTLVEPILPTSLPAMTPSVVTPLLPTTITTQQPATAAAKI